MFYTSLDCKKAGYLCKYMIWYTARCQKYTDAFNVHTLLRTHTNKFKHIIFQSLLMRHYNSLRIKYERSKVSDEILIRKPDKKAWRNSHNQEESPLFSEYSTLTYFHWWIEVTFCQIDFSFNNIYSVQQWSELEKRALYFVTSSTSIQMIQVFMSS